MVTKGFAHGLGGIIGLLTGRAPQETRPRPRTAPGGSTSASSRLPGMPASTYPGDFTAIPHFEYAPHDDAAADPGEVVWTWVPYEEDHSQGKDRPVLILGRESSAPGPGWLLAAQLTSKDHDRDAAQEASEGRYWMDIGTGGWDSQHRPSEVRLNRIIRVDPRHVRRTGGRVSREVFVAVARGITEHM